MKQNKSLCKQYFTLRLLRFQKKKQLSENQARYLQLVSEESGRIRITKSVISPIAGGA